MGLDKRYFSEMGDVADSGTTLGYQKRWIRRVLCRGEKHNPCLQTCICRGYKDSCTSGFSLPRQQLSSVCTRTEPYVPLGIPVTPCDGGFAGRAAAVPFTAAMATPLSAIRSCHRSLMLFKINNPLFHSVHYRSPPGQAISW